MIVLVPAHRPDMRLVALVRSLRTQRPGLDVLVVDDGSGEEFSAVFGTARTAGAQVVHLEVNRGKGAALRIGVEEARLRFPGEDVVTADADGQHRVEDVLRVADAVESSGTMVLGVRGPSPDVPLRSRVGNRLTAFLFRLSTGWDLRDTQTGLRGYPADLLEWVGAVPGQRYEYELNVLLRAAREHLPVVEVPIGTVYEPGNPTSHFRPLRDSARIYAPLLAFSASSLVSSGVDLGVLVLLRPLSTGLLLPVVGARIISAGVNHALNRRVFHAPPGSARRTGLRYALLAVAMVVASWLALTVLTAWDLPLVVAKVVGDGTLYLVSFHLQRRLVFRAGSRHSAGSAASPRARSTGRSAAV